MVMVLYIYELDSNSTKIEQLVFIVADVGYSI